jgi:hypothetical protein
MPLCVSPVRELRVLTQCFDLAVQSHRCFLQPNGLLATLATKTNAAARWMDFIDSTPGLRELDAVCHASRR